MPIDLLILRNLCVLVATLIRAAMAFVDCIVSIRSHTLLLSLCFKWIIYDAFDIIERGLWTT